MTLAGGKSPLADGGAKDPVILTTSKVDIGQVPGFPTTQELKFDLRNIGKFNTLEISSAVAKGGNEANFSVASFPASIAPGGTGEVVVAFDSQGGTGASGLSLRSLPTTLTARSFPSRWPQASSISKVPLRTIA